MIRDVHIKNFKSLKDVSVRLGPRNVLVGPNMAGKSNVVSIFKFLRKMVVASPGTLGLPAAIIGEGGFGQLAWRGAESNLISFSLNGVFSDEDDQAGQAWEYRLEVLGDRQRGSIRIQDEHLILKAAQNDGPLIRRDPGSGRRVLMHPAKGAITEIHDSERSALEFELPDWPGNRLRTLFASTLFYKLTPQFMRQANPVVAPLRLDETGSNLSAWLMTLQTRHQEDFLRLVSAVSDVLPDIERLFTWPTAQSTEVVNDFETPTWRI